MIRFTSLAILTMILACAPVKVDRPARAYAGTVQKVFRITRQGQELPGIRMLGQLANVLGPAIRQSSETHQYVVRTPTGHIIAQSDEEFSVGDCVEVIPRDDAASGPAFRYDQAQVVKSDKCAA
jgi:hypothetical protein